MYVFVFYSEMLLLSYKIVIWCFLVLLLLDVGCQVTALEYTFKNRYSYKKKRDVSMCRLINTMNFVPILDSQL